MLIEGKQVGKDKVTVSLFTDELIVLYLYKGPSKLCQRIATAEKHPQQSGYKINCNNSEALLNTKANYPKKVIRETQNKIAEII